MVSQKIKTLHALIHSMTKGEKRRFTTFVGGVGKTENTLYLKVFNVYAEKGLVPDHELVKIVPGIRKIQLANIRSHLWHQILECLRSIHAENISEMKARSYLDFAFLLNHRGFHDAAFEYSERALVISEKYSNSSLSYHILDVQRYMQSEYSNYSIRKDLQGLHSESGKLIDAVNLRDKLFNTLILLQKHYYASGYVKNDEEYYAIKHLYEQSMPKFSISRGSLHNNILYYQNKVWFYYITQQFPFCYRSAVKWIRIFETHESLKSQHPDLFLKGLHHSLNALFMGAKLSLFLGNFDRLRVFGQNITEDNSTEIQSMYEEYVALHTCNKIFITGRYDEGVQEILPLIEKMQHNPYNWQNRKLLTLHYKIACVYFGADHYHKCLDHLNFITNSHDDKTLEDIRCFARILILICHYELGNEVFVRYQIKAVYRFLHKMKDLQGVQKSILLFLKNSPNFRRVDMKMHFKELRSKLILYKNHTFERRPFLYLDIIAWLDSKLNDCRIQDIVGVR